MASNRSKSRIYWRSRGDRRRAYGDFGDFADVGGGREALIPEGSRSATTDPVIAQTLVGERLTQLQERRRNKTLLGVDEQADLKDYASHHLVEKKRAGKVTEGHLDALAQRLEVAVEFFGPDQDVASITVLDVQDWVAHLSGSPLLDGGTDRAEPEGGEASETRAMRAGWCNLVVAIY